jgi:hypothetical protein
MLGVQVEPSITTVPRNASHRKPVTLAIADETSLILWVCCELSLDFWLGAVQHLNAGTAWSAAKPLQGSEDNLSGKVAIFVMMSGT